MFSKTVGFLGCGNMAKAIIQGLLASGQFDAKKIFVYDHKTETNTRMVREQGIGTYERADLLAAAVDILVLAVKPSAIPPLLTEIVEHIARHTLVVSIASGVTLQALEKMLGSDKKIVRAMPNTPAHVRAAMCSATPNSSVTAKDLENIITLFSSFGKVEVVDESLIHSVIGVSGSSPAYIFLLIEAMADAAVLAGMPREQAYIFAAQAVKGAAQMVLESGKHPGELKDAVCSPGGTTIEAVGCLEEKGFRHAIIAAITRCIDKSKAMEAEATR